MVTNSVTSFFLCVRFDRTIVSNSDIFWMKKDLHSNQLNQFRFYLSAVKGRPNYCKMLRKYPENMPTGVATFFPVLLFSG